MIKKIKILRNALTAERKFFSHLFEPIFHFMALNHFLRPLSQNCNASFATNRNFN